jgi:hypothetical protein
LYSNTTASGNIAHGHQALLSNTTGASNSAVGIYSSGKNTTGVGNAALGYAALYENTTGGSNTAIGREAGRFIADGTTANTSTSNSVFLGYNTKALATGQTNQIVIGDTAVGLGSNTAILGNSSITKTQLQGNVGIGTAGPTVKLDVAGQGKFVSTTFPVVDIYRDTTTTAGSIYGGAKLERLMTGGTATAGTGIGLYFKAPDSTGASTFAGMFGGALSTVTNGAEVGDIVFGASWLGADPHDKQHLIIRATGASTGDVLMPNGNVGIGTTNPSSLLHISSGTSGDATLIIEADTDNNNENDNPKLQFRQDGGLVYASAGITGDPGTVFTNSLMNATYLGSESDVPLQLFTNSSAKLTILSNGNVGIGTTSPSAKLHIAGVNGEAFRWSNSSTVYGKLSCGTAGARIDVTGANSGYGLSFSMDDSTKMVILPSGNVGIGAETPLNKLDIVGSLGRGAPVTKTTDFTVAATENWLIMNGTATITITLPTASSFTGRELMIKNIAAYTVISASSNVKPIDTDTAATAILPATAGSWCTLVSDGTNWVTMMN